MSRIMQKTPNKSCWDKIYLLVIIDKYKEI